MGEDKTPQLFLLRTGSTMTASKRQRPDTRVHKDPHLRDRWRL
jgi:hypothetical protein